ncbi:hypothetical protein Aduo_004260 [Ancylostoma duodenale]
MSDVLFNCFRDIHPKEASLSERLLFGSVILFVTVTSLLVNILVAIVLVRTNAIEKLVRPHIVGMIVASVIYLLTNCWILLPSILGNIHFPDPYNAILATPNTIGYLMIMFTTTTMAIDRFMIFFVRKGHQLLTHNIVLLHIFASIPCIMALSFTLHMNLLGCRKRVNPYTLSYTYACSDCGFYSPMLHAFAFAFPGINFAIYVLVFMKILQMKATVSSKKGPSFSSVKQREIKLVIQFLLICVAQFLSSVAFYTLPPLTGGQDAAFYMTAVFSTLNTMTNPCVIIVFQPRVRRAVISLLTTAQIKDTSTAVSKVQCVSSRIPTTTQRLNTM